MVMEALSLGAQHRTSKVNPYSLFAEATLAKEAVFGLTLGSPSGCRAERRGLGSGTPLLRRELEMRRSRARDAVPHGGAKWTTHGPRDCNCLGQ